MSPMEVLYIVGLVVTGAICVVGALHPRYHDNLVQHIGMATVVFGAVAEVYLTLHGQERQQGAVVFASGVACFAVGTLLKRVREALA